jgi:hypothetical protein
MNLPEMKPIKSSMATEYGYDATEQSLFVRFNSGKLFEYLHVPASEVELLAAAPSFGIHLNAVIKRNYAARPV